jgi:hypothetical protein
MDQSGKASQAADVVTRLELPEDVGQAQSLHRAARAPLLQSDQQHRPLDHYQGAALARARSRASNVSPWLFVMATALNTMVASVLAVIITLGVVRQERADSLPRDATLTSSYARPTIGVRETATPSAPLQQISLPPIGSPNQPLRLEAQKSTPLPLQIRPEGAGNDAFILTLSGAPAGTILSGAIQMSSDTWFLSPGSANLLNISLPEWSTSVFEMTIALRRTNGSMAAQTKAWLAVPPPASRLPASPKIDDDAAKEFLTRANRLLDKGDIVGARTIYQRAAELGNGSAALALGATYDPNRLWSLGVLGLLGNRERARQWYLRAGELGNPEAKDRLTALGF